MKQLSMFPPPVLERPAAIPAGAVFQSGGRFLKVYRVFGDASDKRAPVIVEELQAFGASLKGQFGLWSQDAVARALVHDYGPTIGRGPRAVPTYPHPQSPMGRAAIKSGKAK
jgi:hypothetical protein